MHCQIVLNINCWHCTVQILQLLPGHHRIKVNCHKFLCILLEPRFLKYKTTRKNHFSLYFIVKMSGCYDETLAKVRKMMGVVLSHPLNGQRCIHRVAMCTVAHVTCNCENHNKSIRFPTVILSVSVSVFLMQQINKNMKPNDIYDKMW